MFTAKHFIVDDIAYPLARPFAAFGLQVRVAVPALIRVVGGRLWASRVGALPLAAAAWAGGSGNNW